LTVNSVSAVVARTLCTDYITFSRLLLALAVIGVASLVSCFIK
jgi:hypothetical protein